MFDFKDQVVVVTGGTRGIGRGISEGFLQSGATLIATYHSNDEKAEEFKRDNVRFSKNIDIQRFDISNYEQVERFFDYIDDKYSYIDVLINNAGIRKDAILGMMPREDWERVIDINLTGSFYMCKFAVKNMLHNHYGRIIFITSPISRLGFKGQSNYSASKAGQIAITRSLSKEVANHGITVNCISPGFVATELIEDLNETLIENYKKMIPMKKFATPKQIAYGVLFMASKEADYITGTTLEINGGL
ncbi:MAG: 3-oxoacyl-ACP reductase FabG [bacterium]